MSKLENNSSVFSEMKRREVNRSNGGRQGYSQRLSLRATGVSEDEEQRIYLKKQGSNLSVRKIFKYRVCDIIFILMMIS